MPFDWDKWHLGWAAGLPKNEMWAKIRSGGNDKNGEPTFLYSQDSDTSSASPSVADVIAEHRFVVPSVNSGMESCFCGWAGEDHADHLLAKLEDFSNPVEQPKKKAAVKKPSGAEG